MDLSFPLIIPQKRRSSLILSASGCASKDAVRHFLSLMPNVSQSVLSTAIFTSFLFSASRAVSSFRAASISAVFALSRAFSSSCSTLSEWSAFAFPSSASAASSVIPTRFTTSSRFFNASAISRESPTNCITIESLFCAIHSPLRCFCALIYRIYYAKIKCKCQV